MSFSDPSGYAGASATPRTIEEVVVTANRRPDLPPFLFFAIPNPNQVTLDEIADQQSIIDARYLAGCLKRSGPTEGALHAYEAEVLGLTELPA